jgi:hypothetical protein
MIKQFKQMCLAHQNSQGESKPFIGLTGAQISRDGLSRAVKNEGVYDLAAFFMYSEIEKSGDILCTVYMPEEFRGANRMRVQMLKNRSGELNADGYYDYHVDLASGQRILAIEERSQDEVMSALKGIVI